MKQEAFKRAALVEAEQREAEQRNLLAVAELKEREKKLHELLGAKKAVHLDEIMERSGLNSSEVLATLCNLPDEKASSGSRRANS